MPDEITAGVDTTAAAGQGTEEQQPETSVTTTAGDNQAPDAGGQGDAGVTGQEPDQRVEQAFARRLAAERERIKAEFEAKYAQPQQTQQGITQQQISEAIEYYISQGLPPAVAKDMVDTRLALLNTQSLLANVSGTLQDTTGLTAAKDEIAALRAQNKALPEFDQKALEAIRNEYRQRNFNLPWREAYDIYVARQVAAGNLTRAAEQQAIDAITGRNKATVQAPKGGGTPPNYMTMPKADFEKEVEKALRGEYSKR